MSDGTRRSKFALWLIMLMIPGLVVPVVLVEMWFLYGYLSLRGEYCGPFGQIDGEIGWVLKPGATSCIMGKDAAFGEIAFRGEVTVNADGARVPAPLPGEQVPEPGPIEVLVIGDSFPFGYGIHGKDTFAARLASEHGYATGLFASPAYSNAQALLLGERAAARLSPKYIVYLTGGWERAVCTGSTRPTLILKPCYWARPDGGAELVVPPVSFVEGMAAWGMRPGGMVGAGEKTLGYFLISRPITKLFGVLVRLGLISGPGDDFRGVATVAENEAIREASIRHMLALPERSGAHLILMDPHNSYGPFRPLFDGRNDVTYIGLERWDAALAARIEALPPDQARVPHDGHFGPGTHRLIAELAAELIRAISLRNAH